MKRETSLSVAVDATQGKATPGPWTVQAPMIGMPERYIVVGDGFVVADCGLECPPIDGDGFSALANARLIAAAPDLLSASQKAVARIESVRDAIVPGGIVDQAVQMLKAGIAKAEAPHA